MEFVTFEIAKKLKEKGFKMPCIAHYYCLVGNVLNYNITTDCIRGSNFKCLNDEYNLYIDAPTISQALEWLRENKEVDLAIEPQFHFGKRKGYGVRVFAPSLNKPVRCGYFDKWEEASIAGIEYTLNNLI